MHNLHEIETYCRARADELCGSAVFERVCEGRAYREIETRVAAMRRADRYTGSDAKSRHRETILRVVLTYLILWSIAQLAWSIYSAVKT